MSRFELFERHGYGKTKLASGDSLEDIDEFLDLKLDGEPVDGELLAQEYPDSWFWAPREER